MMPKRIMCNWTHEETLVLLCCLDEFKRRNEISVKKDRITVDDMFREVSTKLWKMGFAKSNSQIRCKWRNMKKKYKIVKAMNLSPNAAVKEWRYYSQLAKLMGKGSTASWVEESPASSTSTSESSKKISTLPVSTRVTRNRSLTGGDVTYAETPPESSRAGSNQSSASEAASGSSSTGRTRIERHFVDRIDSGNNSKPSNAITRSTRADKVCNAATPSKSDGSMSLVNDSAVSGSSRRYDADIGASTSASSTEPSSVSRDFYLDFCKQQMDFMQQSHAQQLSWFKSQMEINQQNHVQQQAWFHEQMVLQRQKEEEMIRRQFEQSKIMTESIVYRLFDGMCQLADNIFNKSMAQPAVSPGGPKKADAMAQLALASIDPTSSPARCVVPPVNLDALVCSPTGSGEVERAVDCVTPDESSPTHVLQITQPFSMMDTSKSKDEQ